jgi:hypothetical protein
MDWIMHIWSKPLGAWTLLDVIGILALVSISGVVLFMLRIFIEIWAENARERRTAPERKIAKTRRELGYDD